MEMPVSLEQKWHKLNRANQKQASDFVDYLLMRQQAGQKEQELPKSNIRLGVWKGEPFFIADDFDAPLDDFKEYM